MCVCVCGCFTPFRKMPVSRYCVLVLVLRWCVVVRAKFYPVPSHIAVSHYHIPPPPPSTSTLSIGAHCHNCTFVTIAQRSARHKTHSEEREKLFVVQRNRVSCKLSHQGQKTKRNAHSSRDDTPVIIKIANSPVWYPLQKKIKNEIKTHVHPIKY
ncbi:hypothetical protein QBC44DRAFT_99388 [Cladorrhinum sp. PSN332]|nr:hypothetical protein QBC44DRAFT_99388 [Cladorrhinum sp. PSN332]